MKGVKGTAFTGFCCDCGKELVGVHQNRFRTNPNRRCISCRLKRCPGRYMHPLGYVIVRIGHGANAEAKLEHRVVMERKLGRALLPGEVVHHINHNRADNREENLKLYASAGEHASREHVSRGVDGRFRAKK